MNLKLFLKHRQVQSSLLSLLGQLIIMVLSALVIVSGAVTGLRAILIFIIILGFAYIFVMTLLRLKTLAKVTNSPKESRKA
jgi:positive regulator of sigma E activity